MHTDTLYGYRQLQEWRCAEHTGNSCVGRGPQARGHHPRKLQIEMCKQTVIPYPTYVLYEGELYPFTGIILHPPSHEFTHLVTLTLIRNQQNQRHTVACGISAQSHTVACGFNICSEPNSCMPIETGTQLPAVASYCGVAESLAVRDFERFDDTKTHSRLYSDRRWPRIGRDFCRRRRSRR